MLHSIELCLGLKRVRGVCSHIDSTQSVKPSTKVQTKKSTGILGSSPMAYRSSSSSRGTRSSTSMLRSHMLFCFEKAPSRHTSPVVCYQALVCPWAQYGMPQLRYVYNHTKGFNFLSCIYSLLCCDVVSALSLNSSRESKLRPCHADNRALECFYDCCSAYLFLKKKRLSRFKLRNFYIIWVKFLLFQEKHRDWISKA